MRRLAGYCLGLLLVASLAGCPGPKTPQHGAWQRWGVTRSSAEEQADPGFAAAYDALYACEYDTARAMYQRLAQVYPEGAEAHVGLGMALRYLGDFDGAWQECEKALALDPDAVAALANSGDLIPPQRRRIGGVELSDSERVALSGERLRKAAASNHPLATYAYTGLAVLDLARGRLTDAREAMRQLAARDYFPAALDDFGRNLLASCEKDAVLFTNGDNDTYPLWALQAEGVRPDVRVVNVSLLNLPAYAIMMRDSLAVPITWDDAKISSLRPVPGTLPAADFLPADQLSQHIVEEAGKLGVPVYFSVTCAQDRLAGLQGRLLFEGLVWRVTKEPVGDSTDYERLAHNFAEVYELDNSTRDEPWPANLSPMTRRFQPVMINYAIAGIKLGEHQLAAGDTTGATGWLTRGRDIAAFAGYDAIAQQAAALLPGAEAKP